MLVAPGCEISRERSACHVRRHRHLSPYAAIVLRGGYVEAGDRGRFRVEAGDVLLHDAFEAHQDDFGGKGADILNIPLPEAPQASRGRLDDVDEVVRAARRDGPAAVEILIERLRPGRPWLEDWPDLLAADLGSGRVSSLATWALAKGLTPSSVSRGFRLCYGISPQRFSLEQKALRALKAGKSRPRGLAAIAAEAGFADQAHMSRTFRRLYGCTPSALAVARTSAFKTGSAPAG